MGPKRQEKGKKQQANETAATRVSLQPRQQEEDASGTGYHTTPYQIDAMVRWLEVPANYNITAGDSTHGKKMAHGGGVTKISGFRSMSEFVYGATIEYMRDNVFFDSKIAVELEAKQYQSRWNSIFRRYRATRAKLGNQTGFGLTEEMVAEGKTVEDLAEECCFKRIDKLFGEKANVMPPSELSEPSFNDSEWFLVRGDSSLSGETNDGPGPDMASSQDSITIDAAAEQENVDPNSQSCTVSGSETSMTVAASVRTENKSTSAVASATTGKKETPKTPKPRKNASKTKATTAADAKRVDKAANLKRKDFGSVYTETTNKRQAFNDEKFKIEWKETIFMEERREKKLEREARAKELQQQENIQRIQSKQTMALELLKAGKPLDEVEKIVNKFFPNPTPTTTTSTEAEQRE